jgi:hypothetical protein
VRNPLKRDRLRQVLLEPLHQLQEARYRHVMKASHRLACPQPVRRGAQSVERTGSREHKCAAAYRRNPRALCGGLAKRGTDGSVIPGTMMVWALASPSTPNFDLLWSVFGSLPGQFTAGECERYIRHSGYDRPG